MEAQLRGRFSPVHFVLTDQSSLHAGHAGARPGGETHYRLEMHAEAFKGLSRVERQRLVYAALREEFETGLHALSLDLKTAAGA
ncbi:MAG: BolA family transcriptional regulator [Hyphomonadaceae bacterium]|nr:BolA family transcriptional regulator [Hyphomonadaceae bacterium]MCA8885260.1 BolA family transcriptional regulator [Hyphomonadaceae bacterium]